MAPLVISPLAPTPPSLTLEQRGIAAASSVRPSTLAALQPASVVSLDPSARLRPGESPGTLMPYEWQHRHGPALLKTPGDGWWQRSQLRALPKKLLTNQGLKKDISSTASRSSSGAFLISGVGVLSVVVASCGRWLEHKRRRRGLRLKAMEAQDPPSRQLLAGGLQLGELTGGGGDEELGAVTAQDARVTLRIENTLSVPLLLDGIWSKDLRNLGGPALENGIGPAGSTSDLWIRGPQGELLVWFQSSQWPFAVVTIAVRCGPRNGIRVAGEWARGPPGDARKLLAVAKPMLAEDGSLPKGGVGIVFQKSGLNWRLERLHRDSKDSADPWLLSVKIVAEPVPTALLAPKRSSTWAFPSFDWAPALAQAARWVFNAGDASLSLREQLARHPRVSKPSVADRRLFDLLGVEPDASPRQIRKAWRQRAADLHPDVGTNEFKDQTSFDEVRLAFQVLSDPTLRSRYETLGTNGLSENSDTEDGGASLAGLSVSLALLLGAWALRPLFGGPLSPPLGLVPTRADSEEPKSFQTTPAPASDLGAEMQAAFAAEVRVLMGAEDGSEEELMQTAAELRAAVDTADRLVPLVEGRDLHLFEQNMRRDVRAWLRAADGSLAPHLLACWGRRMRVEAVAWLQREAPLAVSSGTAAKALDVKLGDAVGALDVLARVGAASLVMLPTAAVAGLAPKETATKAAMNVVALLVDVVLRTALLEIDRRARVVAARVLEDKTRPWQIRWRTAHSLERFGALLEEEGDLCYPDLELWLSGSQREQPPKQGS